MEFVEFIVPPLFDLAREHLKISQILASSPFPSALAFESTAEGERERGRGRDDFRKNVRLSLSRPLHPPSSPGDDRHDLPLYAVVELEVDFARNESEERVVSAHADVRSGSNLLAALPYDDVAGHHSRAAESLHAQPLAR